MSKVHVALIQTNPGADKAANVNQAVEMVRSAAEAGATLVALPEAFMYRGSDVEHRMSNAETMPGPLSEQLASLSEELGIYLLAGSYPELPGPDDAPLEDDRRTYNTSQFFGPTGELLAKYRKIHMFDVQVEGKIRAQESSRNRVGAEMVTADTNFGRVGLSICYDLRFPEVFRAHALRGAFLSFVPSNFAVHTGRDHWEVLLRARAIENGIYVLAPATWGQNGQTMNAYGRSMIVDPWGTVLATAPDGEGIIHAIIDTDRQKNIRESLPSLTNRVPTTYPPH